MDLHRPPAAPNDDPDGPAAQPPPTNEVINYDAP